MKTLEVKNTGEQHLDFAERIRAAQEKSGILELIKHEIATVLRASDDPFNIRGDDDKNVVDAEFEISQDTGNKN